MTEQELIVALTPPVIYGYLTTDDAITLGNRVYRRCACGVTAGVDMTDPVNDYARHVASPPHQAWRRRTGR